MMESVKFEGRWPKEVRSSKFEVRSRGSRELRVQNLLQCCVAPIHWSRFPLRPSEFGFLFCTVSLVLLLLWPKPALASASSALRDYRAGKFDKAMKEYQGLLKHKGDDPRLHFNAGAAAYRDGQYKQAAKEFEEALNSPDLKLQQRAYYNRGNTLYQLGQDDEDTSKKTEAWKKALQDFESSLKLDPQDWDAATNRNYVKRMLEQIPKSPQQSKNDKSDDKSDQQQQKQQNQQSGEAKQGQKSPPQQSQAEQKQDSSQQQQARAQQTQQQQQRKGEEKQSAEQHQQAEKKTAEQKKQQQASVQKGEKSGEKDEDSQAYAPGEMTPQQARQLLDSQKGDEMMLPPNPKTKPPDEQGPLKDW